MFTRHRHGPIDELDYPHALGTDTFSPEWSESFHHILLLPPPSFAYHGRKPTNLRVGLGARAAQFQASSLRVRDHAGACSPLAQRTTTGDAVRCAEIVEARSVTAFDWKNPTQAKTRLEWGTRAFLAKEVLRSQHSRLPAAYRKVRYIHRNPVKAGLCERPEDWESSSFRHYATGCEGRVEIESEWTARERERAAGRLCPAVEQPNSSQNQP